MNPWITGRIIENMQQDDRARGDQARLGHTRGRPRAGSARGSRAAAGAARPRGGPRRPARSPDTDRGLGRGPVPAGAARHRPQPLEQPVDDVRRDFDVAALTPDRWPDLERLFGERGASSGCWCMWWRVAAKDWERDAGAGNRASLRTHRREGPGAGVARLPRRAADRLGRGRAAGRLSRGSTGPRS